MDLTLLAISVIIASIVICCETLGIHVICIFLIE